MNDGTVKGCGTGAGGNVTTFQPLAVSGLNDVAKVCPGAGFPFAIKNDATVITWHIGSDNQVYTLSPYLGVLLANDRDVGAGINQFTYSGTGWGYGAETGAYNNDLSWSGISNDYATLQFFGKQIMLFGKKAASCGIAKVSIDGGTETLTHLIKKKSGNSFKQMVIEIKLLKAEEIMRSAPEKPAINLSIFDSLNRRQFTGLPKALLRGAAGIRYCIFELSTRPT